MEKLLAIIKDSNVKTVTTHTPFMILKTNATKKENGLSFGLLKDIL